MTLLFFLKSNEFAGTGAFQYAEIEGGEKLTRKKRKTRKELRIERRQRAEFDEMEDEEILLMLGEFDDI